MTNADELLSIIDNMAGDAPTTRERPVRLEAIDRGRGLKWYLDAGRKAITQGRMLSDSGWVCRVESVEQLNRVIEHVAAEGTNVGDFIGACNQRKQQLTQVE